MSLAVWREVVAAHGPVFVDEMTWRIEIGEVALRLEVIADASDEACVRVVMPFDASVASLKLVRAEHGLSEAGRMKTGDEALDRRVWIFAADLHALGALTREVRALLVELVGHGATFGPQGLVLSPSPGDARDQAALQRLLSDTSRLGALMRIASKQKRFAALAALADGDPDPAVRRQLRALAEAEPKAAEALARASVKRARKREEGSFEALAMVVRGKGTGHAERRAAWTKLIAWFDLPTLMPLFADAGQADRPIVIGQLVGRASQAGADVAAIAAALLTVAPIERGGDASALVGLASVFERARLIEAAPWLMRRFEEDKRAPVRRAVLRALLILSVGDVESLVASLPAAVRHDMISLAGEVGRALTEGDDPLRPLPGPLLAALFRRLDQRVVEVVLDYVAAFVGSADPTYVPVLVSLLEGGEAQVQLAAIEALALVGTPAELAALTPLTRGIFRPGVIKDAATEACKAIRSRFPHGVVGGLALADDGRGALAVSGGGDER